LNTLKGTANQLVKRDTKVKVKESPIVKVKVFPKSGQICPIDGQFCQTLGQKGANHDEW
jgi:hypothetical protein